MGAAGGIIRSEKLENHKNSTRTKIQFYIISIIFSTLLATKTVSPPTVFDLGG